MESEIKFDGEFTVSGPTKTLDSLIEKVKTNVSGTCYV